MADQVRFLPQRALDANNNPVTPTLADSPKAYFYASGTATLIDIYDADGTPLANPLLSDANGVFVPVFADGDVRVIVKDAAGVTLPGYPLDPAPKAPIFGAAAGAISFAPQDNLPRDTVQLALEFVADRIDEVEGGLGDLATQNIAERSQTQTVWNTGTNTTESLISAAKLNAKIIAQRPVYTSGALTITSGGLLTVTHGFGALPRWVGARLRCTSAEAGYSVDDEIVVSLFNNSTSGTSRMNSVTVTTTQISVRLSNDTNVFVAANKGTGAAALLTNANWSIFLTAAL